MHRAVHADASRIGAGHNFAQLELERTRLGLVREMEKRELAEVEKRRRVAEAEANQVATVLLIDAAREANITRIRRMAALAEEKLNSQIQDVVDSRVRATAKSAADAQYYALEREAAGNKLKLTPAYLAYMRKMVVTNRTSMIYFGPSIPAFYNALGIAPLNVSG